MSDAAMSKSHWTSVSTDPNSAEAIRYRREQLRRAQAPQVRSRDRFMADRVRGKRVLDVGCVDHLPAGSVTAPLHRRLRQMASELVGVDVVSDGVEALRADGYDVRLADVTQPGLADAVGTGFDVVVAGEIVEHLLDLSQFFANVRQVLTPEGLLLVSTPNPHSLHLALHNLAGRPTDNVDHVVYHWPAGMAEIADRCGFELLEVRGERRRYRRLHTPVYLLGRLITRFSPRANAECITLIYVLRPR